MSGGVKLGAGGVVAVVVLVGGFLLWKKYGSTLATKLNPANAENVVNAGVVSGYQSATGSTGTPGADLAGAVIAFKDKIEDLHPAEKAAQVLTDESAARRHCQIAFDAGGVKTARCRELLGQTSVLDTAYSTANNIRKVLFPWTAWF